MVINVTSVQFSLRRTFNGNKIQLKSVRWIVMLGIKHESLILAQNERWRQA